ncbi:MAG: hypothetical protein MI754_10565 [Chromatiales bacterium]|nr:hypothetical protein [Chromatiales bacterium]
MTPAVIDIEASGFGSKSYPIEIGVVTPDKKGHCFLIKPAETWQYWDNSAEQMHGITQRILYDRGKPVEEVAHTLNMLFRGQTLYSDAWGHDISWLGKLFDICNIPQLFRLDSIRSLISDEQAAIWHPTKDQILQRMNLTRHRASSDARALQETYLKVSQLTHSVDARYREPVAAGYLGLKG